MRFFDDYIPQRGRESFTHAGALIRGIPDWQYLHELREEWDGHLIVKGVLRPQDAKRMAEAGIDCIWVSNHSGRQFEAGPAVIDQLPKIREAVGPDVSLIYDSGVAWGLDVMRALAKGADFVMLGRAFQYAVAAFGARGVDHVIHILKSDIEANMSQLGAEKNQPTGRLFFAISLKLGLAKQGRHRVSDSVDNSLGFLRSLPSVSGLCG